MPRRPRIHLPGSPLHIVQRGHNREPCFFTEADYLAYLDWLGAALEEAGCQLHAYVLMTNHVHLLLTPPDEGAVARMMISLGRRYVHYVNRTYQRTGTLWDGRYKSSLVQTEHYMMACQRYIELNPVRAGMVPDPADYRWSSYRANALGQGDPLLTPHAVYRHLGRSAATRYEGYRAMFAAELEAEAIDDIRLALNQGQPLGNPRFIDSIERTTGMRREPRPRGRPRKLAEA